MKGYLNCINRIHLFLILLSAFVLVFESSIKAQVTRKVLFLGNSYTGVNNLPQLVHDVALSAGDTLVFDSNTPGGYQLIDHSQDVTSQTKIMNGGWDYVVIQGQSQEPIVLSNQFISGASFLANQIKQYNSCAVIMPYMTWGRKNGDAGNCPSFPIVCTYQGMDTTLRDRYLNLTASIHGEVSPVSVVWNYLRQNFPNINLYQSDESHPSIEGSYAAACCFYTLLFKKDPTFINFNFGLNTADAAIIKSAAKMQVFDNLQLWDFKALPIASIQFHIGSGNNEVIFNAPNLGNNETYLWDFGDGNTSTLPYSPHSYLTDGNYIVTLTTTNCDLQGLHTSFADTLIQFCSHTPTVYTSQPWVCNFDTLWTQPADSYQWLVYGNPIPETNQYLANYLQYGISGFSVISSLNGCPEFSQEFAETPVWSGYYFDLLGNPCIGDTVKFAVLNINGFLSGFENILWFKNDTLLPLITNEDTLFITNEGKYECKVIDPNSNCPLDTTSYSITYNCNVISVKENDQEIIWNIYPNPASENISIKIFNHKKEEMIQIYNAAGQLVKAKEIIESAEIKIDDLQKGVYFVLIKGNKYHPLKFIKL